MMTKLKYTIVLIVSLSLLTSCAKRGTITGGAKDTIAPKITGSYPKNFSTDFKGKDIKIDFNELIKVKDISKQLIISPPMKKQPIIVPQGSASKFISIKIIDTLKENTTYSFNFGQSISDNNENNPYSQFKYVFSTGSYIDSLTVVGKIKDAVAQKPDNFVSVLLYDAETFTDSTVYKETPLYITNTLDSLKYFSLENLKEGKYRIIALKDKSGNNKFDPKSDKIGFLEEAITLPTTTMYELELFAEKPQFKAERPYQESNNKLYLGFAGNGIKTEVTGKSNGKEVPLRLTKFPGKEKDSLQIYFPLAVKDSIQIAVKNGEYYKEFTTKLKDYKEADSLYISNKTGGILSFRNSFKLATKTPLNTIDESKIFIRKKDSTFVKYTSKYDEFNQEINFDFVKEEDEKYAIELLPGAIKDFYEKENDSLNFKFNTKLLSDYGNLKVNVVGAKRFPIILEVLDDSGVVLYKKSSTKETIFEFETIEPKSYTLRIVYDDNGNEEWDTGNYLAKQQAEEIVYFAKKIDVRANWDVDQEFGLD
ncbi:Ig-like domain-containing protein [Flavobacterium ardleyense]|uniref:Ig-like domain-containing protein n=1 Tax=Flavobacterium ardleyense TaxID=2038737 RepID=A0ABW5Z7E5_9FLAO